MCIYQQKSKLSKFCRTKAYINSFGSIHPENWAVIEFTHFESVNGYKAEHTEHLISWIILGVKHWARRWKKLKNTKTQTLKWYLLRWGRVQGEIRYRDVVSRKTRMFDTSSEKQRERGLLVAESRKGKSGVTPRSVEWWVNKGYSIEEAKKEVKRIQTTNGKIKYVERHGDEGAKMFEERTARWVNQINTPEIAKSRSGGLWRYQERYGDELGEQKYIENRISRNSSRVGKASEESLRFFEPIISLLESNDVKFYCGMPGNNEWFIRTDKNFFLYDLTIPVLSLIVEYHGEAFHPNPKWDRDRWNNWNQAFTGKSADECRSFDVLKREIAESLGWNVVEVYSSEIQTELSVLMESLQNKLLDIAN